MEPDQPADLYLYCFQNTILRLAWKVLTNQEGKLTLNEKMYNFVCFVALRPKSTAMVIAGRSVHLTTLFPGQA